MFNPTLRPGIKYLIKLHHKYVGKLLVVNGGVVIGQNVVLSQQNVSLRADVTIIG